MSAKTTSKTAAPDESAETPDAGVELSPELREQMKIKTAPGWRPIAGETITGTVVDLSVRKMAAMGDQPKRNILIMVLDTGDPEHYTAVWVLHSVLNAAINNLRPSNGDKITIAYHGKFQPADESKPPYHNYTAINPDAKDVPFNWDLVD